MKISAVLSPLLICFFCASILRAEAPVAQKSETSENKELASNFVPALNIDLELSSEAKKTLSRFEENVIIMVKFEGLRANGQFSGPEPPKVLSQTVSKKGGKARFNSFDLIDFDKTPLHFGGIMIQAINTQKNTRRLLLKCSSFSLYPKKAKVLQERFKEPIPISCRSAKE